MAKMDESSGVNYVTLDDAKRLGQQIAATTARYLPKGYKDVGWSRGESVQLVDTGNEYVAGVLEGLGTENLVADAMDALQFRPGSYYDVIGQSTVAVVLNDMATVGAQPLQYFLKVEVCEEEWLVNKSRTAALFRGVARGCRLANCSYMGGETPSLKGMVVPGTAILSGSATGIIRPKNLAIRPRIQGGDRIILLGSSGLHDNGFTKMRQIAAALPEGYQTRLSDGTPFGHALLAPTPIYVRAVLDCIKVGVDIHYAVNITGHGWRKIMRATKPFGYVIERVPKPQPVFGFIQQQTGMSDQDMYSSYNMNAGFALIVKAAHTELALKALRKHGPAMDAGFVVKTAAGGKWLNIKPLRQVFHGTDLKVR